MRIKMNTQQVARDIERIRRKLTKAGQEIKNDSADKIREVGTLGFNFAFNLAPEYTGALKQAMRLEFPSEHEAMIISSHPKGDAIPVHILFDEGIYPNPRIPSSLGFMSQTAVFLEGEFSQRMRMMVSRAIEKVGKHG